jgi:hypothetical protein
MPGDITLQPASDAPPANASGLPPYRDNGELASAAPNGH